MKPLKFNPDCVSRDAGFCYLIEFSDGTLKAGKTIDLLVRYRQHKIDAESSGKEVSRIAHSEQHEAYGVTEQRIIDLLSSMGDRVKDEYFSGIPFELAVKTIKRKVTPLLVSSSVEKHGKYSNQKMISLRLNDYELEVMEQAAKCNHLRLSTWIKQVILRELDSLRAAGELGKE